MAGQGAGPRQGPLLPEHWCLCTGGGEERGSMQAEEDRAGSLSYQKRWRPAPSSHWIQVTLMKDSKNLDPYMQKWVELNRVITTLLFM